ncbi:flagellar M-ring protein FliF [Novosphingobium sp. G106]|uniref:flagellar basal-body MS-ring/collar protein FliF n=1 Tax=Novosphingobium sp. G106 TaxID=2849500 RepID=UPI001C2D28AB|nr:flagellar basal-body MS-ring/collar protein FliF [Novosphingobium sp. G106]MBV1690688.1 flagellar M-ring protein FliF [Novosphingobium sp. G106]
MSDLVPATPGMNANLSGGSVLSPLTDPTGGNAMSRLRAFGGQSAVKRMLPWFLGVAAIGAVALTYSTLAPAPQRTLYTELNDSERAGVVDALDKANIGYKINNDTGALTVNEDDLYKARMLVAQNGSLATPQSGDDMLDKLPMGASRELEGERLRSARQRDLELTIKEINGVEAVRVHLAEAERSVFVRDNLPPTASVMLRLARGRQLSDSQVTAIVNLVAGSIPGLTPDAVRVVDQQGHLLSDKSSRGGDNDRLDLQARMEEKLRGQVAQLLGPMLGQGNFSTEIQVELDMDQVTSARESYDKQGAVRSETQQQSQTPAGQGAAAGVPGVLSNTPPPPTTAQPGPPTGTPTPAASGAPPVTGESSSTRNFELGREVAVANTMPGKLKRISVAVALSAKAMKNGKAADVDQIKQLVSAAVGADTARGDQVAVITRSFEPITDAAAPPFYEAPWFATVVRNAVALIAVLLVLLLGVRPLIKALKREPTPALPAPDGAAAGEGELIAASPLAVEEMMDPETGVVDAELLSQQVGLAQRIVAEKPESAVVALRQMLNQPPAEAAQ